MYLELLENIVDHWNKVIVLSMKDELYNIEIAQRFKIIDDNYTEYQVLLTTPKVIFHRSSIQLINPDFNEEISNKGYEKCAEAIIKDTLSAGLFHNIEAEKERRNKEQI